MNRILYSIILYLVFPFILLRLVVRGLKAPAYWLRWFERLSLRYADDNARHIVWVHAVSVGEVQAATPLVESLLKDGYSVLITTMTPTGSAQVKRHFDNRVLHQYAPYDLPGMCKRFYEHYQPRALLILETEIWPNWLHYASHYDVPVVLVNARLSSRSLKSYEKVKSFAREVMNNISIICAQADADAMRFRSLGVEQGRLQVTGSLKFDVQLPSSIREQGEALRRSLGINRAIWIAASTHEGEDEQLLDIELALKASIDGCLLVLVPRHPERFDAVVKLCQQHGLKVERRTELNVLSADTDVLVVDTMGELVLFYACSDIAFVGGSLIPHGGHNLLEPALLHLPVLVGEHTFNFEKITQEFVDANAAIRVQDKEELLKQLQMLFADPNKRHDMGERAYEVVKASQGTLYKVRELLRPFLI